MKIAIVCDDLVQHGGQEKLVLEICKILNPAVLFTSYATKEWLNEFRKLNVPVQESFMRYLPFKKSLNRFYALLFFYNFAFESFVFDNYDLVISVSSRFAHSIITKPQTRHVAYINSPARMIWEPTSYFNDSLMKFLIWPWLNLFRLSDFSAFRRVDFLVANSVTPKLRINKYLKKSVDKIIYPFFSFNNSLMNQKEDYYLVLSRLVPWKRVDLVVDAFNKNKKKLIVVGDGTDLSRLQKLASSNIYFRGRVTEAEKLSLLSSAKALIFPQYEDFGITPLEALNQGTPVIAYAKGGALETLVENVSGIFFYEQNSSKINEAIIKFESKQFDRKFLVESAQKYSQLVFKKEMESLLYND